MLRPGDIVTPRLNKDQPTLFLWSDGCSPNIVVDEVARDAILIVLSVESFNRRETPVQDERKKSSCLLLSSAGQTGWTGSGWLKKITT